MTRFDKEECIRCPECNSKMEQQRQNPYVEVYECPDGHGEAHFYR